ncbi:uncharacterized protein LOC121182596 [Tachysurus ichikawai]
MVLKTCVARLMSSSVLGRRISGGVDAEAEAEAEAKVGLPPFDPVTPSSVGSLEGARLKVRMARLHYEAQDRARTRQAELNLKLEISKLEIEAEKQVKLKQLELDAIVQPDTAQAHFSSPQSGLSPDPFDDDGDDKETVSTATERPTEAYGHLHPGSHPAVCHVEALLGAWFRFWDCFECTDWNIFREAATNGDSINLEEYTASVTSYIGKCIDDVTVSKTITTRSNQKPWMTAKNNHSPLNIDGSSVEIVRSTKFLGVHLAENLLTQLTQHQLHHQESLAASLLLMKAEKGTSPSPHPNYFLQRSH